MTLTDLEHREARNFLQDELLAETDSRRLRLLNLAYIALTTAPTPARTRQPDTGEIE